MGILFFDTAQSSKPSINLLIGVVPHGTGIINDKIRMFIFRDLIADFLQNTSEFFAVTCIHLTTEGFDAGQKRASGFFFSFFDVPAAFLYKIVLAHGFFRRRRFLHVQVF